jgi:hypothetical protein
MTETARDVLEHREVRDLARANFDTRLALIKSDLEARGVGGRIAHRFSDKAKLGIAEAKDIAGTNKGVVAGTIAALAVWFLRSPILAWIEGYLGSDESHEEEYDDRDEYADS